MLQLWWLGFGPFTVLLVPEDYPLSSPIFQLIRLAAFGRKHRLSPPRAASDRNFELLFPLDSPLNSEQDWPLRRIYFAFTVQPEQFERSQPNTNIGMSRVVANTD
jgi:hypothetical protein